MAVSGSSSRSKPWSDRRGGAGPDEDYASPIPYRVGPLEYEPAVKCKCGEKAARWISWSDDNPGRRYLKCFFARFGGCDFWEWYEDKKTTPFITELLVDLRDTVRSVKKENKELKSRFANPFAMMEELRALQGQLRGKVAEVDWLRNKVAVKDAENVVIVGRVKKLEKERVMFMYVIVSLFVVVVGLILSK